MALFWFINLFRSLGKDKSNFQIALGISVGMLLGLIPVTTLHWFVILAFVLVLRMNLLATMISALVFSAFYFALINPIESLGFWMLTSQKFLLPLWARAYHAPILPFTSFNHSTVMGGTLMAVLLFFPCLLISQALVQRYRAAIHTYWLSTRLQRAYAHYRRFTH